jgi:hypothetical protein
MKVAKSNVAGGKPATVAFLIDSKASFVWPLHINAQAKTNCAYESPA